MEGFDLSTASGIYMGSSVISALYLGSLLIWPTNYQEEYLTITSMNGAWTQDDRENTIKFMTSDPSYVKYIEVSRDKVHWTTYASSVSGTQIGTIRKGQKLYIRGDNSSYATSIDYYTSFWATGIFNVSGNIMALIDSENFREMTTLTQPYALAYIFRDAPVIDASNLYLPATTLTSSCYRGMFNLSSLQIPPRQLPATTLTESCYREMFYQTALEDVPELPATTLADSCYSSMFNSSHITAAPELPATTLASRCYDGMFANCSYLQLPPELPATTLAAHCYDGMFALCTSLRIVDTQMLPATTLAVQCYAYMFESCRSITMAPILPATTLTQGCYWGMFRGCTSLTTAPTLPATTLTDSCYEWMFYNCTSLSTISMLAADISANDCLFEWVYNVASSGTFIKAPEQTSLRINDVSGIPRGWTVESRYVIHIVNTTGGQLVISRPYASPGQTVWVGTVEDEGYDFDYMSVVDSQGNPVAVSGKTFVMPSSSVTVTGYWVSYESMYLTIESLEGDNNVYWKASNSSYTASIEWSFNKTNWTSVTSTTSGNMLATLHTGFKLYLRGTVPGYNDYYNYLVTTKSVKAYGNILSIVDGSNFITNPSSTTDHSVHYLFYNCTHLTDASNIILPNDVTFNGYESMFEGCTSLTAAPALPATYLYLSSSCYQNMFKGCTSLTTAPALPATALSSSCYKGMFEGCTSLATAPALPALGLATACYYGMFKGCTSLETAPDLLASTLQEQCYYYMFDGCTSLNSIKMTAKYLYYQSSTPATYSLTNWVRNVAATGTFYKAASMTSLTVGDSGIPTGWVTVDAPGQYTISIGQSQNGTVTSNTQTADYGDTVTLTATPDVGYELDTLTVLDANSNPVTVTNNQFTMPNSNVTVSATFAIASYINQYFTIESLSANNTISWKANRSSYYSNIQYSNDLINWTTVTSTTSGATLATLGSGNKLYIKGAISYSSKARYSYFVSTGDFKVYGNIMSLSDGDNFSSATSLNNYAFVSLFSGCTHLTDASNLILPITTLSQSCYESMFSSCIALTTAPALPATTLSQSCYAYMFENCRSLTTAPELPATTLATYCYQGMFMECILLTTAPELPATILTDYCYYYMFNYCTSLNYIKCLATDISADYCLYEWVINVAASGTFVKEDHTNWSTGDSGIPTGWTVVNQYGSQYLTIESLEDNNAIGWKSNDSNTKTIQWSTDKITWTSATSSTSGTSLTTLNTGDKLYIKGTNNTYGAQWNTYSYFTSTNTFNVYGNIMSMIYGDNFANTDTPNYNCMFWRMYQGSKVVDASHLILPATVRSLMLTEMFNNCTSLTGAPVLSNSTNYQSHNGMFKGCTSLTTAPVITANPGQYSYRSMFENCSSLNSITIYVTSLGSGAFDNWLKNVAATGTFTKLASMTSFPSGSSGIPSGWTVVDV